MAVALLRLFVLLPLLLFLPPTHSSAWTQDRFVISFWVDPIVPPTRYDAEYQRIKAANFSMLLGGFGAKDRNTVELQVAAANRVGLAAVPSFCGGACANVSGAWGLQIADEPNLKTFSALASQVAAVKAEGKLAFVNLLPNYASSPGQTGAHSYEDYVSQVGIFISPVFRQVFVQKLQLLPMFTYLTRRGVQLLANNFVACLIIVYRGCLPVQFVETVKPNVLSTDHYPDFREAVVEDRKEAYILNMLILRKASLKAEIPWWNFFSS